jgi:hypothetical protein
MPQLTPQQLREFARLGAEARLAQLDAEIAAIKSTYPEIARAHGSAPAESRQARTPAKRRRRYRMSPEARKAAAERMRKYWAERKAAQPQAAQQSKRRPKRKGAPRRRAKK